VLCFASNACRFLHHTFERWSTEQARRGEAGERGILVQASSLRLQLGVCLLFRECVVFGRQGMNEGRGEDGYRVGGLRRERKGV
jgi:hypothetical protein